MTLQFKYIPYNSVGPLVYGMKRSEVRKICGKYRSAKCGFPNENHNLDDFGLLHGLYTPELRLEAVSLFPEADLVIQGKMIHLGLDAIVFINQLRAITDDIKYVDLDQSFVSEKLGMVVFCPENTIENVLLYSEHYYDEENQYLLEHFGVTKFHY